MLVFRARWLFPIDGPPLQDGLVAIDHDRIVAIGDASSLLAAQFGTTARDLGNVAVLPGLINAHTHLEFSDLAVPLGRPGMPFVDWIRLVVQHRRARVSDHDTIESGIAESSSFGVTALGEIASSPWHRAESLPLEITEFCEVIGFRSGADDPRFAAAISAVSLGDDQNLPWSDSFRPGLSPHSPYSVHPALLRVLIEHSTEMQLPLAHHLAESREELTLLRDGSGPLVDLLTEFGQWDPAAIPRGSRPRDYLQMLAGAPNALVIHGNYLADDEIQYLGEHSETMSVVYCPRTHAYFQHEPYPLAKMLAAGVNVALGTDSRASNPDLSVLAELQTVAKRHPAVSPAELLDTITINAAKALGREREIGTLVAGKYADLAVVELPEWSAADPHELLLDPAARITGTIFRGRLLTGGNW